MPFISIETTREIRNKLKSNLSGYKVSVRNRDYSSIDVVIESGPDDLVDGVVSKERGYVDVNIYHIDSHLEKNKAARELAHKILKIVREVKAEEIISSDGDYGDVPNYYLHIGFGRWDKKYIHIADAAWFWRLF